MIEALYEKIDLLTTSDIEWLPRVEYLDKHFDDISYIYDLPFENFLNFMTYQLPTLKNRMRQVLFCIEDFVEENDLNFDFSQLNIELIGTKDYVNKCCYDVGYLIKYKTHYLEMNYLGTKLKRICNEE